jgi:hypothetical protein
MSTSIQQVYSGEGLCSSRRKDLSKCPSKAYHTEGGRLVCGQHSRKETRIDLPRNPRAAEIKQEKYTREKHYADTIALSNLSDGVPGSVRVTKLRMRQDSHCLKGFLKVFPNIHHGHRKDGLGCPMLSPMLLGPVLHGIPGVPDSITIENYFQMSKVYPADTDPKTNEPSREFFDFRNKVFSDVRGYRHKYSHPDFHGAVTDKKPLYAVYQRVTDGEAVKYSYIESRYFYCFWYARLAVETPFFKKLRHMVRYGYNLQIVGYDGYEVTDDLWKHYNDTDKAFGHELCLYTLLTVPNSQEWPWERYRRENPKLYENMLPH